MRIKWTPSKDGYVTSKDGRFDIDPLFMGRTTPQAYDVFYYPQNFGRRERVLAFASTQREAKQAAENYVPKQEQHT